jgi:hypothetical protein|tara:strand:+ start:5904 stop:6302 length:399 start_codon:yes stop_codon:yes gene_type:complete
MNGIIIPNEIFINIIEPYSRKPQSKCLLEDIKSFYTTLQQVKKMYVNSINEQYRRNYLDIGMKYSFYNELLKGLHIICGNTNMEYYSFQFLELQTRYCRRFWAKMIHEERIETTIALRSLLTRYSRRPGDPI